MHSKALAQKVRRFCVFAITVFDLLMDEARMVPLSLSGYAIRLHHPRAAPIRAGNTYPE